MNDQQLHIGFDISMTNGGTMGLRLARKKTSAIDLEITGFTVTSSVAVIGIASSNIPPNNTYYAEFCLVYTNTPSYRTFAKGKITTINSLWNTTNYTGNGWSGVTAPPYPVYADASQFNSTLQQVLNTGATATNSITIGTVITMVGSGFTNTITATSTNFQFSINGGTPYYISNNVITVAYLVTGVTTPDVTGSYYPAGTYGEPYEDTYKTCYSRQDGKYWLWWNGLDIWMISTNKGVYPPAFMRSSVDPVGAYPGGGYTGTATVSLP